MAVTRHVTIEMTDDLDGTKASETVKFSFEGKNYEIDLSKKNAGAFTKTIAPYIEAGRKVSTRGTGSTRSSKVDLAAVRAWAAENGIEVAQRGRIPKTVLEQYAAAV